MKFSEESPQPGLVRAKVGAEHSGGVLRGSVQDLQSGRRNRELEFKPILGHSPKIKILLEQVSRVAGANSNVLVLGESGSGKEVIARAIHAQSVRRLGPFVPVNCSALPEQLLESEFFGHRKGAFTGAAESRRGLFEEAEGGTLFLDEIGDMPTALQAKLLRVLQDKKVRPLGENALRTVNVRVIAATHQPLKKLVSEGRFREDLYYRLAVVTLTAPALRDRREDIPEIAQAWISQYCKISGIAPRQIKPQALNKLMRFSWRGNVRELENVLERAMIFSDGLWIEDLDIELANEVVDRTPCDEQGLPSLFQRLTKLPTLEELEKAYIDHVLNRTGNAREKTARLLGIDRKTLYRKVQEIQSITPSEEEL